MEDYDYRQQTPKERVETPILSDHREYTIKINEKDKYLLILELKQKYIYFIVSSEAQIGYNYQISMDLSTIINKLELNASKYNKLELILKIFDELNEKNKISIQINDNEYCSLILKLLQVTKEETYEIKIYKHYMNPDDKFKIMFNLIKELKNEMNNKISKLNEAIELKDKAINEMNSRLVNQENKIKELEEKIFTLNNNYNTTKEELKKVNNLLINQGNIINKNKNYLENKIDEDYYAFHKEIVLMKELINQNNEIF